MKTKRKIAILGVTGMLGSMMYKVLKDKYRLILVYRDKTKLDLLNKRYGDVRKHKIVTFDFSEMLAEYNKGFASHQYGEKTRELYADIGLVDMVINCTGIIIPHSFKNPILTYFINGSLPHILSNLYMDKLIHITTDCVFDGIKDFPYNERSIKNPTDLYGLTKSLGEPASKSLVIRTSLIGPEITDGASLLEWFKRQNHTTVNGYVNHYWNGLTTKELAKICDRVVSNRSNFAEHGLFHLFSTSVSKYDMLCALKNKYALDITIKKYKTNPIDRRLTSMYSMCKDLRLSSFQSMVTSL